MVAYAETAKVAHVLEWVSSGVWQASCSRGRRHNYRYRDPMNLNGAAITYESGQIRHASASYPRWDEPRSKPWCTSCLRRMREAARDVGILMSDV